MQILVDGVTGEREILSIKSFSGIFSCPKGITADAEPTEGIRAIYIADVGNNRIVKLLYNYLIDDIQLAGYIGEGQLNEPNDVDFCDMPDPATDFIVVADKGNNRIVEYTTTGSFIQYLGELGSGINQFSSPVSVAATPCGPGSYQAYIYVADQGNNRIIKYFQNNYNYTDPVWDAPVWRNSITVSGAFIEAIDTDVFQGIYAVDSKNGKISAFDRDLNREIFNYGSFGTGTNQFYYPKDICIFEGEMATTELYGPNSGPQFFWLDSDIQGAEASPNPFTGTFEWCYIRFDLTGAAICDVKVYETDGTLVKTLASGWGCHAGYNSFWWDGTDKDGVPLPDGTYNVTMTSQGFYTGSTAKSKTIQVTKELANYLKQYTTGLHVWTASWSKNGLNVAVGAEGAYGCQIYTLNADGSNPVSVTASSSSYDDDFGVTWSPDNQYIAFSRYYYEPNNPTAESAQLCRVKRDGSDFMYLSEKTTESLPNFYLWPDWSSDGYKITFNSAFDNKIGLMNAGDGSNVQWIEDISAGNGWSPLLKPGSDDEIVFANDNQYGTQSIYKIGITAGARAELVADNLQGRISKAWSPDGKRLAYLSQYVGSQSGIYSINVDDTTDKYYVLQGDPPAGTIFNWLPDMTKLAFWIDNANLTTDMVLCDYRRDAHAFPAASIWYPIQRQNVECIGPVNIYGIAKDNINVNGTKILSPLDRYNIEYGIGKNPESWTEIVNSTTQGSDSLLGVWNIDELACGEYTFRLKAWDSPSELSDTNRQQRTINIIPTSRIGAAAGVNIKSWTLNKKYDYNKNPLGKLIYEAQITVSNPNEDHYTKEKIVLKNNCDYTITNDTYLEYWIWDSTASNYGFRASVQIQFDQNDPGINSWVDMPDDQNMISGKWDANLEECSIGRWYKRVIPLGKYAGRKCHKLILMTDDVNYEKSTGKSKYALPIYKYYITNLGIYEKTSKTAFAKSGFELSDYAPYEYYINYFSNVNPPDGNILFPAVVVKKDEMAPHAGVSSYKIEGVDLTGTVADDPNTINSADANSFAYWKIFNANTVVPKSAYLSFWRNLAETPNNQGRIFIDGATTDGQTFRDTYIGGTYLCDQHGARSRPDVARPDATGEWRQYIINLSSLAGKTIDYLMVGYDDGPNEIGAFKAYFDDVEILDNYPYQKQWYAEKFGGNDKSAISFDTTHMYGGAQLVLQVNNTATTGLWVQGPALRKDIDDTPITVATRINWLQYDKDHSLMFELLVADVNGKEEWLIYGANASNHWDTGPGYVNMAVGQVIPGSSIGERVGRYNVWEKYSRNISEDYLAEFSEVAAIVKELRISHYSYTGTDLWAAGDHGGTIKSIVFSDAPRLAFTSGFEGTDYTSFADYPYENTIVPAFGGAVGTDNGIVPHSGSKMYKIQGTDVNGPDLPKDVAKAVVPAIDGKTYWNLYDPFVKIGSSSYLSFWMYVYASPTNFGQIFIDATTKSGKRFSQVLSPSNIYLCDTSGVRITPSIHKAPKGKWVNYVVNLTNAVSYPTGLENEIINRLMLGYDDATNDQKGEFIAYVDDIQLLTSSPVYDQWTVAHYGGDANATIGWQEQTGGGAKLVMDNNGGEPVDYVMGPWVINELSEPIAVSSDRVINWSQYDPIHALSFAAKIAGKDGKARWLCYSANGQNHAADPLGNEGLFGFVNMGITQETYNQWQTFNRNVYSDYLSLFGVEPSEITALGVSHFSYASWDGDNGGAVRDISFGREGQNWQTIATLLNPLATAYNNANRLAVSALGTLHLALSGIDEILYTYSADQGRNWATKQSIGQGQLPAIAVSSTGAPAAVWIQQWNATTPGFVLYSAQTNAGWSIPETLASIYIGPYDYIGGYSPPSITIKNDVVSIVYEYAYQIGIPPLIGRYWRLNQVQFPLSDPQNRLETVIDSTSWHPTDPWANPTSATLATDIKGNDHIAWHRDNKVFYRMRNVDGTYGAIVQLSGPDNAANPSISVSGVASVVWEENGDICMRQGLDQSWDPMVNISQTSSYSAMPTVLNNEVVWSEYITDYNADIFQSQYDITKMAYSYPSNLSQTENLSTYNHLATYKTLKYTKYYRLWTEVMTPYEMATDVMSKTYYDILFSIDSISNISRPLYALDAGQVNPSIFTLQRDGYIQYADEAKSDGSILPYKTVDYDSTALIYQFDNIDTTKIIDIVLSFYHELDGELKLKPMVDDIPLGEVKVPSKQEIVLEKRLPAACYRDGMLTLQIEKNKGPIAVCGKILIYENPQGNGHGGAQSAEITSITPNYINKLYQNCPNPFSHKTSFNYQIKNQGQVTFKVYNALGQLVKTLVNETKPAGTYQVEWDGKDGCGRQVSSGVYLYKINTGSFESTKKLIVLK